MRTLKSLPLRPSHRHRQFHVFVKVSCSRNMHSYTRERTLSPGAEIQIQVQGSDLSVKPMVVYHDRKCSVRSLKSKLRSKNDIDERRQVLRHKDVVMEDDRRIQYYSVQDGSVIDLEILPPIPEEKKKKKKKEDEDERPMDEELKKAAEQMAAIRREMQK